MITSIFKKDIALFFKDKKAVILTFLLPIFLISLFALTFGGTKKSKPLKFKVLVSDLDLTDSSKALTKELDSLPFLTLIETALNEAKDLVKKGKQFGVITIEKGFENHLKQTGELNLLLEYDDSKSTQAGIIQGALMQYLMKNYGKKAIEQQVSHFFPAATKNMLKSGVFIDPVKLTMSSINREKSTKENPGLVQAVVGTGIMMLLFGIAGIGGSLLEEKENGTLKRLVLSPIKLTDILFGKMLTTLVISIAQLIVMFLFSWLVFDLNIFKDIVALSLMILATAFAVSGFGVLIVSLVKSRQQLSGFSTIVILVMSALGGSMMPIFMMPEFMQKLAVISVNYWGIQGFFDIFWRELPLVDILPRLAVLVGIGLIMTFLSIPLFKKNIVSLV